LPRVSASDPGSPSELRAANRQRLLGLLRARGPMTQADLARASGLSPATVSSIARELRDEGWLEEGDGGRRAALALSRSAGVAVGIDFGHSHVRVAIADLAHTVLAEAEELMEAELGRAVRVENDANLGALAEIVWGAGRGRADVVYVKVATGVGAGLVLSGRLYQGAGGTAGEIGHVTIDERGRSAAAATTGA
jgi:DNA-binding Lrp family transcriptional regulator